MSAISPRLIAMPPELYTGCFGLSVSSTRVNTSAMSSTWIGQRIASL